MLQGGVRDELGEGESHGGVAVLCFCVSGGFSANVSCVSAKQGCEPCFFPLNGDEHLSDLLLLHLANIDKQNSQSLSGC